MSRHPTIKALKDVLLQQARYGTLHMFLDFHAHCTKKGIFVFGNALNGAE